MADWQSARHLTDHFGRHGRKMGHRTIAEYDAAARAALNDGTYFEFVDPTTGEPRIGCFDRPTGHLVILNSDDEIVSFYPTAERYVRRLPYNNYDVGSIGSGEGPRTMPKKQLTAPPPALIADRLEEVARRLVAIHVAIAQRPEGGPEIQAWTQDRIEELMSYVDDTIDLSK
jgi:hypothetical protein